MKSATLLLACALAAATIAAAATCCRAQEEDYEAGRKAYKELFVRSSSHSVEGVLERLQTLERSGFDLPLGASLLISFNVTEEAKCDSYDYVSQLKSTYELVENNYKAMRKYMHDCLRRQLDLCNFEQRFRERFDSFKAESPAQWQLIQEFNKQAEKMGKRSSDWQSGALDNKFQMNEALEKMARKTAKRGEDPAKHAYDLALQLRAGCSHFDDRLSAGLLMTTIDKKNRKNKDTKEWYRLMSVCRQVGRVSFEPALGDIFGQTYYPEIQQHWEAYSDWRQNWA